jgi:hypothetical protein
MPIDKRQKMSEQSRESLYIAALKAKNIANLVTEYREFISRVIY